MSVCSHRWHSKPSVDNILKWNATTVDKVPHEAHRSPLDGCMSEQLQNFSHSLQHRQCPCYFNVSRTSSTLYSPHHAHSLCNFNFTHTIPIMLTACPIRRVPSLLFVCLVFLSYVRMFAYDIILLVFLHCHTGYMINTGFNFHHQLNDDSELAALEIALELPGILLYVCDWWWYGGREMVMGWSRDGEVFVKITVLVYAFYTKLIS